MWTSVVASTHSNPEVSDLADNISQVSLFVSGTVKLLGVLHFCVPAVHGLGGDSLGKR